MPAEQPYAPCPSLEEILAAARPDASPALRAEIKERIRQYLPANEALDGAIRFLQDHHYDFDALHAFLHTPLPGARAKVGGIQQRTGRVMAMAAVLAGIIWTSWYLVTRYQPNQQVADAAFYEPGLPVYAGIGGQKRFQEMMSAYRGGEIAEGLGLYRQLAGVPPVNDTLQYFGAWLYYQNKQSDSAALLFEQAASISGGVYREKAEYMQAISLYLAGRRSHARLVLEQVATQPAHAFKHDAHRLLQQVTHW